MIAAVCRVAASALQPADSGVRGHPSPLGHLPSAVRGVLTGAALGYCRNNCVRPHGLAGEDSAVGAWEASHPPEHHILDCREESGTGHALGNQGFCAGKGIGNEPVE